MTENNKLQTIEQQLVQEKNVSDNVLNKVRVLESQGNLELPNDYSPSNAMKQAWLQISQDNKLMSCNDTSKANALLDMVTQGLNPAKNQCYFIPYGNKMQLQRSYHGNVMMLKRDAGAQDVVAQVIYKGDTFKQEMGETGRIKAIKHEQDFFNIDKENIIGAYCTIVFNDGRDNYIEVMTIEQIKQAWMQSSMIKDEKALQNSKTHNNFKEEMAKKQLSIELLNVISTHQQIAIFSNMHKNPNNVNAKKCWTQKLKKMQIKNNWTLNNQFLKKHNTQN